MPKRAETTVVFTKLQNRSTMRLLPVSGTVAQVAPHVARVAFLCKNVLFSPLCVTKSPNNEGVAHSHGCCPPIRKVVPHSHRCCLVVPLLLC